MTPTEQYAADVLKRLPEMKERCERATPAPWTVTISGRRGGFMVHIPEEKVHEIEHAEDGVDGYTVSKPTSEFIRHSRTDLPDLIKVIESIPALLEQAKREAYLEAAKMVCPPCRVGAKMTKANGEVHHFDSTGTPMGLCKASAIHRKLAEPEVKS